MSSLCPSTPHTYISQHPPTPCMPAYLQNLICRSQECEECQCKLIRERLSAWLQRAQCQTAVNVHEVEAGIHSLMTAASCGPTKSKLPLAIMNIIIACEVAFILLGSHKTVYMFVYSSCRPNLPILTLLSLCVCTSQRCYRSTCTPYAVVKDGSQSRVYLEGDSQGFAQDDLEWSVQTLSHLILFVQRVRGTHYEWVQEC